MFPPYCVNIFTAKETKTKTKTALLQQICLEYAIKTLPAAAFSSLIDFLYTLKPCLHAQNKQTHKTKQKTT